MIITLQGVNQILQLYKVLQVAKKNVSKLDKLCKVCYKKSLKKDLTNFAKCDKSGTFMAFIKFYKFQ